MMEMAMADFSRDILKAICGVMNPSTTMRQWLGQYKTKACAAHAGLSQDQHL